MIRRPGGVVGLAVLLLGGHAAGQVAPYQVVQTVEPYVGLGPSALEFIPGLGDASTRTVNLPFDLTLYGETYDTVYVNANGIINVTSDRAGLNFSPSAIPATGSPNGYIAALWDDWCVNVVGCPGSTNPGVGVFYEIDATPGQGRLSVEWRRVRHFSDTQAPSDVTFKLTWHEGPASLVELHYGPASPGIDFTGGVTRMEARVGIEDAAGTDGMWLAPCAGRFGCETPAVQALADTKITILADAGEDVTVTNVSAPEVGYPGLPLPITGRVVSRHQNPLGPLRYAVFLLPAAITSTVGQTPIFESAPITLPGFESLAVDMDLEVPIDLPRGQYRVAVVADVGGALAETDEFNNIGRSARTVRIADRAPDFRVISLRPLDSQVRPGQTLEVAYQVDNFGNEPGVLNMLTVLSANRAITTSDLPFGAPQIFMTASREVVNGTLSAVVPADLQTGLYYVGAILDPQLAIDELDEANNIGRTSQPIVVVSDQVEIVTESLPRASLGVPYSVTLQAVGGDGGYAFEMTGGYTPRGMVFDEQTGTLSGVPLQAVAVEVTFQVTSGRARGTKTMSLVIEDPTLPLTLVSRRVPAAILGQDYAVRLLAVGGVWPYGWSMAQGSLPPGLRMSVDGDVYGEPGRSGVFPTVVRVRDNAGTTSTVAITFDVRPAPNLSIASHDLPAARLNEPYLQSLFATGGIPPLSWRRITTPPPGLILTTEGNLQGSAEQVGRFRFIAEVTDAVGNVDTNELVIDVESTGRFRISTESLPLGAPGTDYRAVVRATGGDAPYNWSLVREEGRLPAGFTFEPGAGVMDGETVDDVVLDGRLEREGQWAFTLRVVDARGRAAERALAIVSRVPPPEPDPVADAGGCRCLLDPRARDGGLGFLVGGLLALVFMTRNRRPASPGETNRVC